MISVQWIHSTDSISEWFGRLKAGEAEAAQKLWNRYSAELLRVAKQRLGTSPCGIGDEEDVALSVFGSIFRGVAEGRFDKISTRDELWWLLLTITKRKAVDHIRRETAQKRRGQRNQQEIQHGTGPSSFAAVLAQRIGRLESDPRFSRRAGRAIRCGCSICCETINCAKSQSCGSKDILLRRSPKKLALANGRSNESCS